MTRRVHVVRTANDAPAGASAGAREVANGVVQARGWRVPAEWSEVDREGAIEVLSSALMNDLVDDAPRLPFREAEERARSFVAECAEDAVFLTNGTLEETRKGFGRRSITGGKADAGVVAVTARDVRMFWIEDGAVSSEA